MSAITQMWEGFSPRTKMILFFGGFIVALIIMRHFPITAELLDGPVP